MLSLNDVMEDSNEGNIENYAMSYTSRGGIEDSLTAYPNFPRQGINFYDVGGILANPNAFAKTVDVLAEHYKERKIDAILAVDSRGFLFATPLAYKLNIPVVMVRKPGKLPGKTMQASYKKEYGTDVVEIQKDALNKGQRVIIIDDLIATGGTMHATIDLATKAGAEVIELTTIVELTEFEDTRRLNIPVFSVVKK